VCGVPPVRQPAADAAAPALPARLADALEVDPAAVVRMEAGGARPPLGPGELLLIGDADNPAADHAKAGLHAWLHVGRGGGVGGTAGALWLGGDGPADGSRLRLGPVPPIVSFYTEGTAYEAEAARLRASCNRLGLEAEVVAVADSGSWASNCAMKASVVRDAWRRSGRGVVWLDADATLAGVPRLLGALGVDFAVHRCDGWQFASGTLAFGAGGLAGELLDRWVGLCERDPGRLDQESLDLAWESLVREAPLRTLWLPQAYTRIFDRPDEDATGSRPVVLHHQASRRLRPAGERPASAVVDAALLAARRAARPRARGGAG